MIFHQEYLSFGRAQSRPNGLYNMPRKSGFTLIELLVVIAIIAMLLAILTPSLKKAKDSAKQLICLSNERQMGLALQAYLFDHENRLPPSSCHLDEPEKYWLHIISDYAESPLLFQCPSDRSDNFVNWNRPLDEQSEDSRWSSFGINSLLDPDCQLNRGYYNNAERVKRPMYCVYICEAPDSWKNVDHLHPESWETVEQVKAQIAWNRHKNETSNYLFVDGHAENLPVEKTWAWPGQCYWYPGHAPGWPPVEEY